MNREDDLRIALESATGQLELVARELRKAMEGTPVWDAFKDMIHATERQAQIARKALV